MTESGFEDHCIISCGILHAEITRLVKIGFMNPRRILFTPPGLHTIPKKKLEDHLIKRITHARSLCSDPEIIVVYGKKCNVSTDEPLKLLDTIVQDVAPGVVRVQGDYGYDMLEMFHPYLDATNVDLKAFREKTYHRYVGAGLKPVLDSMVRMKELDVWLEVTTLVIPGINDDPAELRDAAQFVAQELGAETPWHISRYYPAFKMTQIAPTPLKILQRAQQIGLEEGLQFVYIGNIPGEGNDTFCPSCGRALIRRHNFGVIFNRMVVDHCSACGEQISGVAMGGDRGEWE